MPYPLSIRQIAYVPENTKNPKLGNRIPFFVPTLSAIVLGIRDEGGKGRQKFVEDLVRHSGRKTLLYRQPSGRVPFYPYLGLKPQAQSYSPFGTKNPIRSKYPSTFSKPQHSVRKESRTRTKPFEGGLFLYRTWG
jgi:hypothetical protein